MAPSQISQNNAMNNDYEYLNTKQLNKKRYVRNLLAEAREEMKSRMSEKNYPTPINTKQNRRKLKKQIVVANIQNGDTLFERVQAQTNKYFETAKNAITLDKITDAGLCALGPLGQAVVAGKTIADVKEKVNKVTDGANSMFETANRIMTRVEHMFDSITGLVGQHDWLRSLRSLIVGLCNVYLASKNNRIYSFVLNISNFAFDAGLQWSLLSKIFGGLVTTHNSQNEVVAEHQINSLEDLKQLIGTEQIENGRLYVTGLVVILFTLTYKVTGTICEPSKMLKFLGDLGKNLTGIKQLKDNIESTTEYVIRYYKREILNLPDITELDEIIPEFTVWMNEVRLLMDRIGEKTIVEVADHDPKTVLRIESLYKQGIQLSCEITNRRLSEKTRFPFEQHMKFLTEIYKKVEYSGAFGNKPRVPPIVIWMFGASGVGKSGVTWPLAIDLNNELLGDAPEEEKREFAKNVYYRNVEQEFWDGYTGQNVVCYDDFGQMKDAQGTPNAEFFEIIRTANIAPYPLHMAQIEEKKKSKFTSKVAILSSNKSNLNVISLTHPDAVNRRIDLKCRVEVIPDFAKQCFDSTQGQIVTRLDPLKVEKELKVPLSTHVYMFRMVDPENNQFTGEVLNYAQFRDRAVEILRTRIRIASGTNDYLRSYAVKQHADRSREYPDVSKYVIKGHAEQQEEFRDALKEIEAMCPQLANIQINDFENVPLDDVEYYDAQEASQCLISERWRGVDKIRLTHELFKYYYGNIDAWFSKTRAHLVNGVKRIYDAQGRDVSIEVLSMVDECITYEEREQLFIDNEWFMYQFRFLTQLEKLKTNFVEKATEELTSLKEFIMTHKMPIVLSVLGMAIAGFTLFGGWSFLFGKKQNNQVSVPNVQLKNGAKVVAEKPTYIIENFDPETIKTIPKNEIIGITEYNKKTIMRDLEENELDGYTFTLKNKLKTAALVSEANASGDSVTAKKRTVVVEGFASGDNVTANRRKVVVEANTSGDSVTRARKTVVVEANPSGDCITKHKQAMKIEATNEIDAEIQEWKDKSAQLLIQNRIMSNLYRIVGRKENDECVELLNGLFVRGRVCLVPKHLIGALSLFKSIVLENSFKVKYEVPVKELKFVHILSTTGTEKEASLMYLESKYIHNHADIVKHFQTSYEMGQWKSSDVCLPTLRYFTKFDQFLPYIQGNTDCEAIDSELTIRDQNTDKVIYVRQGLRYKVNTKSGDCGTPIIVNETGVLRKIAGIHVAGQTHTGIAFGESVSKRDLESALSRIDAVHQIRLDMDMFGRNYDRLIDFDDEDQVKQFCDNVVPSMKFVMGAYCAEQTRDVTRTELRPSLISGTIWEPSTKPAYLKSMIDENGDVVNIKTKNLKKAAMDTPYIPKTEVDSAVQEVKRNLLKNRKADLRRVLTFEEAITGTPDSEFMKSINRSSSPGYPWILQRKGGKGKQQWLGDDEYIFDAEVRKKCEQRIELAKLGMRMPTVWVDTLKDERRPIAKVEAGKTRVFANGPMDYTIVFRQYFLGFMAHVMENRIANEQSIGTNVWSKDWGRTAKYLQLKGSKVIAGDFSTFDGTLNSCIVGEFVKVINEYYNDGPENALIREVLFTEVYNSIHLCDYMFYMWTHSQPSGCPITTVLNSFYNSVSMRIVFNRLARAHAPHCVNKFQKYCTMVSYGDDNVVNISDEIIDWFNQQTITYGYGTIGMIYTDEAKTDGLPPKYRQINEVAYLKRQFQYDDDRCVWNAPLDIDVVHEMTNWIRGDLDQKYATLENVENAIRELSLHERDVFERDVQLLNQTCLDELNALPEQQTYDGFWEERLIDYFLD